MNTAHLTDTSCDFISPDASGYGQQLRGDWPALLGTCFQSSVREDPSCKCANVHQSLSQSSCSSPLLSSPSPRSYRIRGISIFSCAGNSPLPLLPVWESLTEEEAEWWPQQCGVYMCVNSLHTIQLWYVSVGSRDMCVYVCIHVCVYASLCVSIHADCVSHGIHICYLLNTYKYETQTRSNRTEIEQILYGSRIKYNILKK